jgi:hypothetical protein
MAKSPPPFEIHVDPSCISEDHGDEGTESAEQVTNSETVTGHDSLKEMENKQNAPNLGEEDDQQQEIHTEETQKKENEARERRIEEIEAEIQAAADAVMASVEKDEFDNEGSVLSAGTNDSYDQETSELIQDEDTILTYREGTGVCYESEHESHLEFNSERAGDSSSHHEGDIDDDVFSHSNRSSARSSARSSLQSCHDLDNVGENQKLLTSPGVGEEAASSGETDIISRVPSRSYIRSITDQVRTPSKVLDRPPFRTPSSVRAMQLSSPTQSLFSSPRSVKRNMPTVSRLGTPTSRNSPTKRTPTRFKVKKEYPLVLLHVTVLPLHWSYSHVMSSLEIPECLHNVRDSWKLLQNKIGDTVLERGVLLAHPQDSYEILEERLLEALELPVRPRARILKCGHYMGPTDSDAPSSDEELGDSWAVEQRDGRSWCDVCRRSVRLEDSLESEVLDQRFRIKIYASNGLMRAGAWAAAWREMERVDIEIEPFVPSHLNAELEHLSLIAPAESLAEKQLDIEDDFVDEDIAIEHADDNCEQERREAEVRLREEEVKSRMAEEEELRQRIADDEQLRQLRIVEEEMRKKFEEEERLRISQMAKVLGSRQRTDHEDSINRGVTEEADVRETYGHQNSNTGRPDTTLHRPARSGTRGDDSFSELLIAAFKVAMRDSKNIAIMLLSIFVLLLALRTSTPANNPTPMMMSEPPQKVQLTTTIFTEVVMSTTASTESLADTLSKTTETSVVFVTKTVAAPQVTTTVVQEKTVTQMVPVPSEISKKAPEVISIHEDVHNPLVEPVGSAAETVIEDLTILIENSAHSDDLEIENSNEPSHLEIEADFHSVIPETEFQTSDEESQIDGREEF